MSEIVDFDATKYYLGKLCKCGHDWNGTEQSLRRLSHGNCIACCRELNRKNRKKRSQQETPIMSEAVDFDATKYYLGKLCKRGHDWNGTGQTLKRLKDYSCIACHKERCREQCKKKRLQQGVVSNRWTEEEDKFLIESYGKLFCKEIAKSLGRTRKAVAERIRSLGLSEVGKRNAPNNWSKEEDKVLQENWGQMSTAQISRVLGRSKHAILHRVRKLGLPSQAADSWSEEEVNLLLNSNHDCTAKELQVLLQEICDTNRTSVAIRAKANKYGLIKAPSYTANAHFFDTPNPLNCYYAGFIAADGCINDRGGSNGDSNALVIEIHYMDTHILRQFAKDTQFTGPIRRVANRKSSIIQVSCAREWFPALKRNFNITPRKSKTDPRVHKPGERELQPPNNLDLPCSLAFIAGLLDGDGSIGIHIGRGRRSNRLTVDFLGSRPMMQWVKETLEPLLPNYRKGRAKSSVRRSSTIFRYAFSGRQAEFFCQMLLEMDVPRLLRKETLVKAWLSGDSELIAKFLERQGRGKRMSGWRTALEFLKERNTVPQELYPEELLQFIKESLLEHKESRNHACEVEYVQLTLFDVTEF